MAVRVTDILFRAGGATLKRLQSLVSAGAGRTEVAHTFARATVKRAFRDRDGNGKRASAGNMGLDWPSGLVDASGAAIGGPLSEGARTQLVTDPENLDNWSVSGTIARTSGQTDPFGGTGAYLLDGTTGAAYLFETVTFPAGTATRAFSLFMKWGGATNQSRIDLFDVTAGVYRQAINITWDGAGVPTLGNAAGSGFSWLEPWPNGWYRINGAPIGVIGANTNEYRILPDGAAALQVYAFGANAWNAPFPQSYQAPGDGTGVADVLTSPFNFGPQSDLTILVRLGRPQHADAGASTALGVSPGIFSFGAGSAPRIGAYFDPAARNIIGVIDTATTDQTVSAAIPAGNPTVSFQFKNLTTGGQVAIDTGSGLSAFSSAATAFSAFSSQTLRIGRYDDELYGVIGDMVVARGLWSRADMLAVV